MYFTKYSRIMQLQGMNIVKNLMKFSYFFLFFDLQDSPEPWEWPHLSSWVLASELCWCPWLCPSLQHLSRGYYTFWEEWSQHFDFPFESQLLEDDPTSVDLILEEKKWSQKYWILFDFKFIMDAFVQFLLSRLIGWYLNSWVIYPLDLLISWHRS